MDYFKRSSTVRLRTQRGKYLFADEDECGVSQSKDASKQNVVWTVEFEPINPSVIKLKSCYNCYLTATNAPFLLGMTGKKVLQMKLVDPESSVYWEPIRDGYSVKLKTISGGFLRANGSIPPWRNSVTHDSTHKEDWLLWEVVPVGDSLQNEGLSTQKPSFKSNGSYTMGDNLQHEGINAQNPSFKSNVSFSQEPSIVSSVPSFKEETVASKPKVDGRKIYYAVAGDDGEIPDDFDSEITFIGHNVKMLAEKLKEETGIEEDIYVCAKNHKTKRLFPLLLQLPPQNSDMYVVVVKASSTLARTLGGIGDEKVQHNDDAYS